MSIKYAAPIDLGNFRISSLGTPSSGTDAATKNYVDSVVRGLEWKQSVRLASNTNHSLSAPGSTVDGVTANIGDRILLRAQTNGAENGIYIYNGAAAALTRAPDAATSDQVHSGMAATCEDGVTYADKCFVLATDGLITVGTTALTFTLLGGATLAAGSGVQIIANTLSVLAGTGITVGSNVAIDTSLVVRKYSASVGDGTSTSISVPHNLNTRDVTVQLYTNATPYDTVTCGVQRTDVNTVTLTFATAPASGAYRVVVHA